MTTGKTLIPELAVTDPAAAATMLTRVFGFVEVGGYLILGSQCIALVQAEAKRGHGRIDHLALAVEDVDATLAALIARGARLEETTPAGPQEIAEFWDGGVRYVFLQGPEGARIELCARRAGPPRHGLPGHDHVGIPCTDIAATEGFFLTLGLTRLAGVTLERAEGETHVRFLAHGDAVVELYEPPHLRGRVGVFPENALWHGLRLTGAQGTQGALVGPDGLRVTLL